LPFSYPFVCVTCKVTQQKAKPRKEKNKKNKIEKTCLFFFILRKDKYIRYTYV
jgi:hypothetical protein